jgi:hypothetical protein
MVVGDHEMDQIAHHRGLVAIPPEFVIDAVEAFRGIIAAVAARSFDQHGAALHQSAEVCGYLADVHARPGRDLGAAGLLPEIDQCQIDPALGAGQILDVGAEILGVVIDQFHQMVHQLAQRAITAEAGQHHHQARAAAGQDAQRADLSGVDPLVTDRLPELAAFFGVQWRQVQGAKEFEKRLLRILEGGEMTGGGGQQHDLRLRLQNLAQIPAESAICLPAQGLQVFDHDDQFAVEPVGGIQDTGPGAAFQRRVRPLRRQGGVAGAQVLGNGLVDRLAGLGEKVQALQPEIRQGENFLALLHQPHRQ